MSEINECLPKKAKAQGSEIMIDFKKGHELMSFFKKKVFTSHHKS